jgi:elongation factor Ts
MNITAALVKELRERTGAGMMECKKALTEHKGNIEAAIEAMRIAGQAQAAKKAGRIAAEGLIAIAAGDDAVAMIEINCETDFVSKGNDFINFCQAVADGALTNSISDVATLNDTVISGGKTVEEKRKDLIAKIGENMNVRRMALMSQQGDYIGIYQHGIRIGVLVDLQGGDADLAKDIAMHIAASRPVCIDEKGVPADLLQKEKDIFIAQAKESGKPEAIIEKMITGRIHKYLAEITLVGQAFVKDPDVFVGKLLAKNQAKVLSFVRFEVGEGLEKKNENFADEVMQQVNR